MRARNRLVGVRILVIEDDADIRGLLRWRLDSEGATVVEASTGHEALERAAENRFNVALTDLGLPDMAGEAVVAALRSTWGERAVIAVISGAHREEVARALRNGAERAFGKPIDWTDLIRYLAHRTASGRTGGLSAANGAQGPGA